MLFDNHSMSLVTNLDILGYDINNVNLLIVASICSDTPNHPNIYNASILIPPTDILMAWADGYQPAIPVDYVSYLSRDKDCNEMITALLAALTKKNVVLYMPEDDLSIYGMALLNYIYINFGITVECHNKILNSSYSFNQIKVPYIISMFYMMNLMEPLEYLESYPAQAMLPEFVIVKLGNDLQPFNRPASFDELARYFNELNKNKLNNKPKINLVSKVIK